MFGRRNIKTATRAKIGRGAVSRPLRLEALENRQLLAELAQIRLAATDLNGAPVNSLLVGNEYLLKAFVKDTRATPVGVFSAYMDLTVNDNNLLTVMEQSGAIGGVVFGSSYVEGRAATNAIETSERQIDEVGAFTQNKYFGADVELFQMRFRPDSAGTLQFGTNPAEDFGKVMALRQYGTLADDEVSWGSLNINVVNVVSLTNDNPTVQEDAAATTINVLANDPSGGASTWTIQSISGISAGGTVQITNNGKSISYRPAADFYGVETFKYRAVNGSGVPGEATVTVNVTAVNDAPRNRFPPADRRVTDEDTTLTFATSTGKQIGIWDDGVAPATSRVNLFAIDGGTISLPNLAALISQGKIFLEGGANGSAAMQIRGLTADVNAALEGLQFTPKQDFFTVAPNQLARIRIWTREVGGTGAALQADNTFEVTVNSINDAPVNVVPGAQTADPSTRVLTFDSSKRISTSDADVGSGMLRMTVFVNNGVLALGSMAGLTFRGGANNSKYLLFDGTQASVNNALLNLRYTGNPGATSDVLTVDTYDLGNAGGGGAKSDRDTINISISSQGQNQAPVNTVPAAQNVTSVDRTITFDASKRISTNDPDVGNANLRVTLFVNSGILTLGTTTGLTFRGGGNNTKYLLFDGTQANINNALLNLKYEANVGATSDVLTIDTYDLGNTGAGGAKSDRDTVALTINAQGQNQAPVNTVPGAQTYTAAERTVTFDNTKRLSTNDPDVGGANLRVTVFVNNGVLKLGTTAGLTIRGGADNTRYILFDGTQAAVNAALLNLKYTANAGVTSDVLTLDTYDLGNSGAGGAKSDRDTVALSVSSQQQNQAPVNTVPGAQTFTAAGRTVTFDSTKRISTNDPDVGGANLRVTVFVNNGVLKLGTTDGLTFRGGADNTRYMLFDGTQAAVNAALLNLKYTANAGVTGDLLTVDTYDLGNTGAGGAKADRDTVALSVDTVNQAPVNTVPGAQTFTATNRVVTFDNSKRISTNDPDVGSRNLRITLFVNSGILTLGSTTNLSFQGGGNNTRYMLFDGTQANVNNALLNLKFTAGAGSTSDTLTIDTYDLGNTGSGGAKSDRDTVSLTQSGTSGRSGAGGSGESGSRNSPASTQASTTKSSEPAREVIADSVFAESTPETTLSVTSGTSVGKLIEMLASYSSGRARISQATDAAFGDLL